MKAKIKITRGESLDVEGVWTNLDDGSPVDMSGRTMRIVEAQPAALTNGTVTITDVAEGKFDVYIPASVMAKAGMGDANWIRLGLDLRDGCPNTTTRIWIEIV